MPSQLQDTNLDQIDWDSLTVEQLEEVAANDDRETAKSKAQEILTVRRAPAPVQSVEEYNPREDPGPKRWEDVVAEAGVDPDVYDNPEEVPLESSVKDHTTILSTDLFDNEGNVINREVPAAPDYT